MSQEKILLCQDKNNGNIVRYKCVKRDVSSFEVDCFFSTLYGMKLNSSEVNSDALKDGATTNDLINELRFILEDDQSSVINFHDVLGLFNLDSIDPSVFETPIKNFLGMYEVNKDSEYSPVEWRKMVEQNLLSTSYRPLGLQRQKEEIQSIKSNTKALQNINLRNYAKRK